MIPEVSDLFPVVLCHNDVTKNNMLLHHIDNSKVLIIDFEYSAWNPMAMDLANWVNETMIDNTHPSKNRIKCYTENIMDNDEIEIMVKTYLKSYFEKYMKEELKKKFSSA